MTEEERPKLEVHYERAGMGERKTARARDTSLGGLFLETDEPFEEGVLLHLEIVDGADRVTLDARVLSARTKAEGPDAPAGMAVRFLDLPEEAGGTLRRILARRMPRERTVLGIGIAPPPTPPEYG